MPSNAATDGNLTAASRGKAPSGAGSLRSALRKTGNTLLAAAAVVAALNLLATRTDALQIVERSSHSGTADDSGTIPPRVHHATTQDGLELHFVHSVRYEHAR